MTTILAKFILRRRINRLRRIILLRRAIRLDINQVLGRIMGPSSFLTSSSVAV